MKMDSSSSSECQRNKNAFEGIAPSSPDYPPYDVFINHRGPDTKQTLAALIYKHLSAFDLRVFLDRNEIRPGDVLPATIQAALATSTVHVAIFSPRYAESSWCLDELSYMLTTGATILPIFYDVEPFHLRCIETGLYSQAFQKHQEKHRIDPGILQKWKQDLRKVSMVSGIVFNTSKDEEPILLKRIVERVVEETRGEVLDVAKHPIGLDEALQAFQNTISKSDEQYGGYAKLVGIVGMGGSGKTTLAKKIYNERSSAYKGCCCFLSDVRSEANKSGLTSLQSRVLKKLLHYDWEIDSISQGIEMMRSRLKNQKVLLILDDVDNVDQIDALLAKDVLEPGSLVILTSRDRGVLLSSGVAIFHEVKGLGESQARELFCWHAFLLPSPLKEFEDMVDKFLIACSGLPLSLKVIGALLYNRDLCHWNGILEKIGKHILPGKIVDTLEVSFDALDKEEKEIFLDIACFFAGEEKSKLIRIWDGSGWSGVQSLENLEQKCLVEFAHQNQGYEDRGEDRVLVRMHDHLRDMGRSVIDNQSQPTRLWRADDIGNYLSQIQHVRGMVTEVRGICKSPAPSFSPPWRRQSTWNDGWKRFLEICGDGTGPWSSSSAVAARALKLLHAEGDSVITEFNYLLRHLIWLRLDDCRDADALSQLCVPNLRVVELFDVDCNLKMLWQGQNQVPTQLRELYVRSKSRVSGRKISCFTELPKSIGLLRNLEKIVLHGNMTTLPDELCQLLWLNYLDLSHCDNLQSLPSGFGNLTNLRHLDLFGCRGLQALPNSFSQLIQLQYLSLRACKWLMVSMDILRNIVTLEYLELNSSVQETLPTHITNQRLLRNLYVHCPHLKELPVDMDYLCNLRVLQVATATMKALPSSLTSLTSLKSLILSNCPRLQCLPESIAQLQDLEYLNLSETRIEALPSSLTSLTSIKSLNLSGCRRLQCLPEPIAQLQALEYLNISGTGIQALPQGVAHLKNLQELHVRSSPLGVIMLSNPRDEERSSCLGNPLPVESLTKAMIRLQSISLYYTETTKLCITTDVCPNLETLEIMDCKCLTQVEALPIRLVNLVFNRCQSLKKVEGLQNLTRLRHFDISRCFELQELVDLSESRKLEFLRADGCCRLTKMQGLQQLQQLRELQLEASTAGVWTGIKYLKELPSKVCSITLNMQTVGAEEIQVYEILNSLRFPISVFDFKFGGVCKVEPSEVRSCSGVIVIHLCENGESWREHGDDDFLTMRPYEDGDCPREAFTTVHARMKSECQWIILSFYAQGSRFLRELKEFKIENNMLLCDTSFRKNKSWVVLLKDKEEEIWEKLFSYAYCKRAFKDEGHNGK